MEKRSVRTFDQYITATDATSQQMTLTPRTPYPVSFGTFLCNNERSVFPVLKMLLDFEFRTSPVLLFCFRSGRDKAFIFDMFISCDTTFYVMSQFLT